MLADGDDPRAREAAGLIAEFGISPILVTDDQSVSGETLQQTSLPADVVEVMRDYVDQLAGRGGMDDETRSAMLADPLLAGIAAVKSGFADGCVAGAARSSADVVRAAIRIIGLEPQRTTLSSSFVMVLPDGRVLCFGDCAVVPQPNSEQLSEIAIATAQTYRALIGDEPVVAMLSFSTKGSADHPSVEVVREATRIVQAAMPSLQIDGELQFDAAFVPEVGLAKAPGSQVAGRANVMVFPNLDAGNIAYKVTERVGGAIALGPLLQGLAAPVNDLSRGCQAHDILNVSLITCAQAMSQRKVSAHVNQ